VVGAAAAEKGVFVVVSDMVWTISTARATGVSTAREPPPSSIERGDGDDRVLELPFGVGKVAYGVAEALRLANQHCLVQRLVLIHM
jgi:hypothetical protein